MFEGLWYFQNDYGLLPDVEIQDDKFDDIWEKMGAEIRSKLVTMLPVTQFYIVFC